MAVEDQILERQEPAADPAGVPGGGGAAVQVRGEPGSSEFPVAGDQVLQHRRVQDGQAGETGGGRRAAGLDEQARQLRCPVLLAGLEVVQALEIAEQVNPAPGVQRIGQVPVPGRAMTPV